jgi:hypothetical protein
MVNIGFYVRAYHYPPLAMRSGLGLLLNIS